MPACILCGANDEHEPACPHFMRGPDPGGDPYEWPTLYDAVAELAPPDTHSKRVERE